MVSAVTDPELLAQLNGTGQQSAVTDPSILAQLNGEEELTWGEVGTSAVSNFGSNAADYGGAIADMVTSPVDSFMAITKFLGGGLQEAMPDSVVQLLGEDKEGREMFNGFVDSIKNDYGSMNGFKKALAERPVETMSDLSIVFNAGGLAKKVATSGVKQGAKIAPLANAVNALPSGVKGAAQKAGSVAGKVVDAGRYLDPLEAGMGVLKAGGAAAGGLAQLPSGVGSPAIKEAFGSGVAGGSRGDDFRRGMRSPEATFQETLDRARQQVSNMRGDASKSYRSAMDEVGKSTEVIDFTQIDEAVQAAKGRTTYMDQVTDVTGAKKLDEVQKAVENWKQLGPEYHTAEGIDALKQMVGNVRDGLEYGTNARHTLDGIYSSIRSEVSNQAPIYSSAMKNYGDAQDVIKQMEKTLSLGRNSMDDTTLRKLQSIMRDGVQTNYGARGQLAETGAKFGDDWRPLVAGQSLASALPQGVARAKGASNMAAAGILGYLNPATLPLAVAGTAMSSPRLVGEAAHAAGRATSPVAKGAGKVKDAASKIPGAEGILDFVTDPVLRNILYQTLYAQGEPSQ